MNLSRLTKSDKIILAGAVVAIISLFMTWVDTGILSANGFQQQGYVWLVCFIYPIFMIFNQKAYKKKEAIILFIFGIVSMLYFFSTKSVSLFGSSVSCAASGMYIMLLH